MPITSAEIDQYLAMLEETPQLIMAMSDGLDKVGLHTRPDPDSWSMNEILAHLRACADVWGKGILAMIAEEQPRWRYISPRTWIKKTDYPAQDFHASLASFGAQRHALLQSLRALSPEDWSRGATVIASAKEREETIFLYVRRMVEHERQHLVQMEGT